jgi:excisionase family DNA binding protein
LAGFRVTEEEELASSKAKVGRGPKRRHIGGSSTLPKRPFSERKGVLLTEEEAADYLGVTKRFVERTLRATTAIKVGRLIRYPIADLDAYIERQRKARDGGEA